MLENQIILENVSEFCNNNELSNLIKTSKTCYFFLSAKLRKRYFLSLDEYEKFIKLRNITEFDILFMNKNLKLTNKIRLFLSLCESGRLDLIELLDEEIIREIHWKGNYKIIYNIIKNSSDTSEYLLNRGINILYHIENYVRDASYLGDLSVIKFAIKHGFIITDKERLTCLDIISSKGYLDIIKYFATLKPYNYKEKKMMLKNAIKNTHTFIVDYIRYGDTNFDILTTILLSIECNNLKVIIHLGKLRERRNVLQHYDFIKKAIKLNYNDIAKYIYHKRDNSKRDHITLLQTCIKNNNIEMLKIICRDIKDTVTKEDVNYILYYCNLLCCKDKIKRLLMKYFPCELLQT